MGKRGGGGKEGGIERGRRHKPYLESVHVDTTQNFGGAYALGDACESSVNQAAERGVYIYIYTCVEGQEEDGEHGIDSHYSF